MHTIEDLRHARCQLTFSGPFGNEPNYPCLANRKDSNLESDSATLFYTDDGFGCLRLHYNNSTVQETNNVQH